MYYPSSTPPRITSHLCLPFLNGLLLTLFWVSRLILMILKSFNLCLPTHEKNVTGFVPGQQTNATVILTSDYQKSISDIWFRSSQCYFRVPTFNFRLPAFGHSIPEFEILFPTINVESFCFRLRTSNFRRKPSDFGHSISEFYFRPLTYNILTSGFRLQFSTNLLRPDLWRWTFKIGV